MSQPGRHPDDHAADRVSDQSQPFSYDKNGNETAAPGRTATYNLLDQTTNLTISGSPTSLV